MIMHTCTGLLASSTILFFLLASTASAGAPAEKAMLRLITADRASGNVVPARVYLTDRGGKSWAPPDAVVYEKGDERHFVMRGECSVELPAGRYDLLVERGAEYRPAALSVDLAAGEKREVKIALERWIAMNSIGWYSGDLHNHRQIGDMPLLLLAEDLNLAPTLTDWIWEDNPISRPPDTTEPIRQVDPTHVFSVLDKEVERLKHGPGAVDLLGLRRVIPFDGYWLYPPNERFCRLAREQGGYVDAEKIVWRDGCALVALGLVDFAGIVHNHFNRQGVDLETLEWGMIPKERPEFDTIAGMPLWSMEVYYRLLNCGFRLPLSAGSASGVKQAPLGYNRVYVRLNAPFSYENWFKALKSGRSFGTNGPMLFLTVDAAGPGETLSVEGSTTKHVRIRAESLSPRRQDRLEVLFKGQVIRTIAEPDERGILTVDFDFDVTDTGWFAARSFEPAGRTIRFAHTSPVYVRLGNRSGVVPADARFFLQWIDREMDHYRKEPRFRKPEERAEMLKFFEKARAVYQRLVQAAR
jgi:hypothetical protein